LARIVEPLPNVASTILLITRGSYNCSLFRVDTFRFWNLFPRHHALVHRFLVFPSLFFYDFCICFSSNQGSVLATLFKGITCRFYSCSLHSTFELPCNLDKIGCV
jgi:hypothetical protein